MSRFSAGKIIGMYVTCALSALPFSLLVWICGGDLRAVLGLSLAGPFFGAAAVAWLDDAGLLGDDDS